MVVPGGCAAGLMASPRCGLMRQALLSPSARLVRVVLETEAMLGSASPRKPRVVMCSRSSRLRILLVAWVAKASARSSGWMPQPLSRTRMSLPPPSSMSMSICVAPASMAFSMISLTTEAGRSMTSPAAIWLMRLLGSCWMRGMGVSDIKNELLVWARVHHNFILFFSMTTLLFLTLTSYMD